MPNTSNPASAGAPAAPPASSPPRARGTRPKRDDANTLRDAATVLLAVKKHARKFVAADEGRKVKRIDNAWIAAYDALVKQGSKARGGQRARAVQAAGATTQEIAARGEVFAAATLIRDDIATSYPGASDDDLRRAFGVGARTKTNATSSVLALADSIIAAYANERWLTQAIKAGVTPKKIGALQALRDTLATFDAQQTAEANQRAAGTESKNATLTQIRNRTAYARKVARVVLRGNAAALRDFASGTPRRTPKPRGAAKKAAVKPKKRARVAPPRRGRAKKKSG